VFLGFLCCVVTSFNLGLAATRVLNIRLYRGECLALGYIAGSALTSTLTFAIGLAGFVHAATFAAIGAISLLGLWLQRAWLMSLSRAPQSNTPVAWRILLWGALGIYGVLYLRQAFAPELSADGFNGYHLGFVNLWSHAGRVYRLDDMLAAMPMGTEMLFLFAFAIGGHSAAALVHASFLLDLPLLMLCYGRRFVWPGAAVGFAAILVFASPLIGVDGTVAYNDVALAAVAFSVIYLLQIWRETRDVGALILCGALAGFAIAIKYSAVPLPLLVLATVAWESRKGRTVAVLVLSMTMLCAPYFLRNWIWYDNPVAYFENAMFPNRWVHVSMERHLTWQQTHPEGFRWSDMPLALTVGTSKLDASFGPAFLLMPLCLAGLFWRQTRLLALASLAMGAIFLVRKDPRFIIAAIPVAAMALGFVLSRVPAASVLLGILAVCHLVVSWPTFPSFAHFPSAWQWRIVPVTWAQAFQSDARAELLARSPDFVMARQIEALVPERESVLAFTGGAAQSWTTRRMVVSWESAYGERMADLFFSKWHSPEDSRQRASFRFPAVRARRIQVTQQSVVQQNADKNLMWNVDEIEFRSQGGLLPVSQGWRLSASPNPWDVGLAFDANLATRWRSWDALQAGMTISADFPRAQELDAVDVILDNREWTTLDQGAWVARVALRITTEDGKEMNLNPQVVLEPVGDLRMAAAAAVEHGGIHYLLINKGDWMEREFRGKPEAWNMHAIAATEKATLYKLD
jgi:dolichyl-phosphate-mannose-protein mannosyltransferase